MGAINSGLTRIILIDSYLPGKRYIIDLHGQTNITGDNGLGKTSLIKLPVIFYGERPTKLGIQHNIDMNHKGFSGRYLPRDGSYVIFEYKAQGNLKCAVFLPDKNTEEGLCRYFIDTNYNDELFFDDDNNTPISRDTFIQRLTQKNIRNYSPRTYELYRSVLLDGTVKGQTHFSMVPAGARMSRLHDLFSGMLNRSADFTVLCKIIEGWAHNDIPNDAAESLKNFKVDKGQLQSWVKEYQAQNRLNSSVKPELIKQIKDSYEEYKFNSGLIPLVAEKAASLKAKIKQQIIDDQSEYDASVAEINTGKKRAQESEGKYSAEKEVLKTKLNSVQAKLDTLESCKKEYETTIGSNYQSRINKLGQHKSSFKLAENSLKQLNAESENIESWHTNKKNEVIAQFESEWMNYKVQLAELSSKQQSEIHGMQQQHVDQLSIMDNNHQQDILPITTKISDLELDSQRITTRIDNPVVPKELSDLQDQVNDSIETLTNKRSEYLEIIEEQNQTVDVNKQDHQKQDGKFDDIEQKRNDVLDELGEIDKKLNSHQNSLLNFLKTNVKGWEDTFGKVVKEEVLTNYKLDPHIINDDDNLLFGISIDTSALPEPSTFDIVLLESEKDKQVQELESIESLLTKHENILNSSYTKWKKSKDVLANTNSLLRKLKPQREALDKQSEYIQKDIENWIKNVRKDGDTELKEIEIKIETATLNLSDVGEKHRLERQSLIDDYNLTLTNIKSRNEEAKRSIQSDMDTLGDRKEKAINELQEIRDTNLSKKGIDPAKLTLLEQRIDSLKKSVEDLESLSITVAAYNKFMNSEYPKTKAFKRDKKELSGRLTQSKVAYSNARNDLFNADKALLSLEKEFNVRKEKTRNQHSMLIELQRKTQSVISLNEEGMDYSLGENISPEQLSSIHQDAVEKQEISFSQLSSLLIPLKSIFLSDESKGTSLHNYWINNSRNENNLIEVATLILDYLENSHGNSPQDNDVRILRNSLNDLDKLNNYVDYISNFSKKITKFSKQLDTHMEQVSSFESLQSLTAVVYFSLTDTQTWKDMKKLSDAYSSWKEFELKNYKLEHRKPQLPSAELFEMIEDYVENSNDEQLSINDLADHIDFRIRFYDKGVERRVKSKKQLSQASSNALSYLILVVLFIGFVNMVRRNHDVQFVWALDELTEISKKNIEILLSLLNDNNIHLISACPNVDEHIYELFDKTYELYETENKQIELGEIITEDDLNSVSFMNN
ncbi:MAG: ATP-binding protein [Methylophaga sp.]|nr:ATP-binding protein [Methylophaga sp.]